ncbi:hypothetical protein BMT54_11820 [Pasteurellaceae bacterium 15-036681]|nr:hypothetical protein BMT54_11820 [Pasteurellaceae bacterium 15-036681]
MKIQSNNNWVIQKLTKVYLTPTSKSHQFLTLLNQQGWRIYCLLFGFICAMPLLSLTQLYFQGKEMQVRIEQYSQTIEQEKNRLNTMQEKQQSLSASANNQENGRSMVQINQAIKQIIEHNHGKIEQIQWGVDGEHSLNLIVNQQTSGIFQIIRQLNQLEQLAFREITLLKFEHARLIQLNAQLITNK